MRNKENIGGLIGTEKVGTQVQRGTNSNRFLLV